MNANRAERWLPELESGTPAQGIEPVPHEALHHDRSPLSQHRRSQTRPRRRVLPRLHPHHPTRRPDRPLLGRRRPLRAHRRQAASLRSHARCFPCPGPPRRPRRLAGRRRGFPRAAVGCAPHAQRRLERPLSQHHVHGAKCSVALMRPRAATRLFPATRQFPSSHPGQERPPTCRKERST